MTPRKYSLYLVTNTLLVFVVALGAYTLYKRLDKGRTDIDVTDTIQYACGNIDASGDGKLDLVDFARFAQIYNAECTTSTMPAEIPSCGFMDGDLNGRVNIVDFATFASRYGRDSCIQELTGKKIMLSKGQYSIELTYNGNFIWSYSLTRPQSLECRSITVSVDSENKSEVIALIGNDMLNDSECTDSTQGRFIASGHSSFAFAFENPDVGRGEIVSVGGVIEGFNFEAETLSSGEWEYTITGHVPDGCTDGAATVEINDSTNPSSVTIVLTITQVRDPGILCTQAIEPITLTGIYSAPENSTHSFLINEVVVNSL